MKSQFKYGALRKLGSTTLKTALCLMPLYASAQSAGDSYQPKEATNIIDMFTEGHFSGDFRTFYYTAHNAFYNKNLNQNTVTYGAGVEYQTATLNGFSIGTSAYIARGLARPVNPSSIDGSLGPNITALGEAYLQWEHAGFKIVAGNQQLDLPFTSTYDYRIAPQLFQGVATTYGNQDNYVTAFRITRWKSWISNSFTNRTTYNADFDSGSTIGNQGTSGFAGAGGAGTLPLDTVVLKGQAFYINYMDYAKMTYLEGRVSRKAGEIQPYAAAQLVHETGSGNDLLGPVSSQVYGFQVGVKRKSVNLSFGYDYTKPNANSYLNGSLVTPYAHNMSSGPLFAQPFITSTQDLGSGSAYAVDLSGNPTQNLTLGARYSFMDLTAQAGGPSLNQSEYLAYATYNFDGSLKGFSATDFLAVQSSPAKTSTFIQNRLQLQYAW
ncbi:MAG: hypothetical protein JWQ10_2520 [Herbaspirillum sp.]|nr:hypothetical protein [Herbaspirillum sp.]